MSKTSREIIDDLLEYAVKFAEMNEDPNKGAYWDAIDGARKYLAETAGNGAAAAKPKLNEIAQVVVFGSGGITHSVAIRDLPEADVPCIVVDYDDRHDDAGDISPKDFERKRLGVFREEFDKTATYIW